MARWIYVFCLFMVVLVLSACGASNNESNYDGNGKEEEVEETTSLEEDNSEKAGSNQGIHVDLRNKEGEVIGSAVLEQETAGVHIQVDVSQLSKGTHGFHIHEKGVCEGPDFKSAGGHFNPSNEKHGFDNPEGPHSGDLPNLEVGENGKVKEAFVAQMVTLEKGMRNSLLREGGTSLVIHAEADDNVSQPAGNAGERIACGVIKE